MPDGHNMRFCVFDCCHTSAVDAIGYGGREYIYMCPVHSELFVEAIHRLNLLLFDMHAPMLTFTMQAIDSIHKD
jgi:hypothetical protein